MRKRRHRRSTEDENASIAAELAKAEEEQLDATIQAADERELKIDSLLHVLEEYVTSSIAPTNGEYEDEDLANEIDTLSVAVQKLKREMLGLDWEELPVTKSVPPESTKEEGSTGNSGLQLAIQALDDLSKEVPHLTQSDEQEEYDEEVSSPGSGTEKSVDAFMSRSFGEVGASFSVEYYSCDSSSSDDDDDEDYEDCMSNYSNELNPVDCKDPIPDTTSILPQAKKSLIPEVFEAPEEYIEEVGTESYEEEAVQDTSNATTGDPMVDISVGNMPTPQTTGPSKEIIAKELESLEQELDPNRNGDDLLGESTLKDEHIDPDTIGLVVEAGAPKEEIEQDAEFPDATLCKVSGEAPLEESKLKDENTEPNAVDPEDMADGLNGAIEHDAKPLYTPLLKDVSGNAVFEESMFKDENIDSNKSVNAAEYFQTDHPADNEVEPTSSENNRRSPGGWKEVFARRKAQEEGKGIVNEDGSGASSDTAGAKTGTKAIHTTQADSRKRNEQLASSAATNESLFTSQKQVADPLSYSKDQTMKEGMKWQRKTREKSSPTKDGTQKKKQARKERKKEKKRRRRLIAYKDELARLEEAMKKERPKFNMSGDVNLVSRTIQFLRAKLLQQSKDEAPNPEPLPPKLMRASLGVVSPAN